MEGDDNNDGLRRGYTMYTSTRVSLADRDELDLELERRVGRDDGREAACAVCVIRRAGEQRLLADRELDDPYP